MIGGSLSGPVPVSMALTGRTIAVPCAQPTDVTLGPLSTGAVSREIYGQIFSLGGWINASLPHRPKAGHAVLRSSESEL
jgi:hypothetical protein